MKKNIIIKKNIILFFISIFLTACGGGGGGGGGGSIQSSSSTSSDNSIPASSGVSTNYFQYAWHTNPNITNIGYKALYGIDNNAHINITTTWSKTKGKYTTGAEINQSVKVAIIDEDFEVTHPDINSKIISTYNVMDNTTNVSNTNKLSTSLSHGTAVAGAIASSANNTNSLGIAPDVELILINIDLGGEFTGDISTATDGDFEAAFKKADELGAKVINCSWGGGELKTRTLAEITRLRNKGITIIFSSGNNGANHDSDSITDPSELDDVIGVGASGINNDVASYSNYGSKIDILAPGGDATLSLPLLDKLGTIGRNVSLSLVNNNYTFGSVGTSFSAPIVSGVAALMYAVKPTITPDQLRTILITTSNKIGTGAAYSDVAGDGTTSTFDSIRAYGKINASKAVTKAESLP